MLWGKGSPVEPGSNPPSPPPAGPPAAAKSISGVTLFRVAVAVVVVGAAAWFGWHKYTEHQDAEATKRLDTTTVQSMQDYLNRDSNLSRYNVRVLRVDLNKVSNNKYEGIATVRTAESTKEHLVPITVTNFGDRTMWQAEPGAFLFLAQEAIS